MISVTMVYASTITSKGQVLIPKEIRDQVGIKFRDRILFELENSHLFIRPAPSIDSMFGSLRSASALSKVEMKKVIRGKVVQKYKQK